MNGMEMNRYDNEPSTQFKDRAKKSIEGHATTGNDPKWANVVTADQQGFTGPDFGKDLIKKAIASKKKRNDSTGTFNQFGDDIEMVDGASKVTKKKIATESMKRIKFKSPLNGVGNALKLIPEAFRVDNKEFEMTDGKETYRMKWHGTLAEGMATILTANSKDLINEDFAKIKHLMGYKAEDTLGTPTADDRINENSRIKAGIPQGFTSEGDLMEDEEITMKDGDAWEKIYTSMLKANPKEDKQNIIKLTDQSFREKFGYKYKGMNVNEEEESGVNEDEEITEDNAFSHAPHPDANEYGNSPKQSAHIDNFVKSQRTGPRAKGTGPTEGVNEDKDPEGKRPRRKTLGRFGNI